MNTPISPRLLACCDYINPGDRVADIGCDHGYLGIYLLTNGIASKVYAADIKPQPLASAIRNAEKFQVQSCISFYLSDGAKSIPHDFDTLVCAGMGGDTIVSILDGAPWLSTGPYRLVLQCQSKTHLLRKYLSENGWAILREKVLRDGRFLYSVMEVSQKPGQQLTPGQWYFSPALLSSPSKESSEYFLQIVGGLKRAIDGRKENADPVHIAALNELYALADITQWLKGEP